MGGDGGAFTPFGFPFTESTLSFSFDEDDNVAGY